jgi:hypothetical protein
MRKRTLSLVTLAAVTALGPVLPADPGKQPSAEIEREPERVSPEEARGRARLLHEVIRGALQIMHRDFFDPDERDRIPSSSLEDMFETVEMEHGVKLKWLGVNAKLMDSDHRAEGEFEKKAVAALSAGALEFDSLDGRAYRFVGAIRLHNACLKCHVPFRDSLETRLAGLSISIPVLVEKPQLESP